MTADYEVFGDGSGDVRSCLIDPTDALLSTMDRHGAGLTIFFEVCEYWAFKEAEADGLLSHLGYSPSWLMEEQARRAVAAGHDVQLHLHPQWGGSRYRDGRWWMNFDSWRLPNLADDPAGGDDSLSLRGIFRRGKETLETMLRPVDPDYRCVAFRAGAWCIQPEEDILKAMSENNFLIDSTVAPGLHSDDGLNYYDFRGVGSGNALWKISDSVTNHDPRGALFEIPISTMRVAGWRLFLNKLSRRLSRRSGVRAPQAAGHYPAIRSASLAGEVVRHLLPQPVMFDYCTLKASEMEGFVTQAVAEDKQGTIRPLVAIGHPKNLAAIDELKIFMDICTERYVTRGVIRFSTFREVADMLLPSATRP